MQHHGVGQRNLDVGSQCGSLVQSYQLNFHNWCLANARRSAEHVAAAEENAHHCVHAVETAARNNEVSLLSPVPWDLSLSQSHLGAIKKQLAKNKINHFSKSLFLLFCLPYYENEALWGSPRVVLRKICFLTIPASPLEENNAIW